MGAAVNPDVMAHHRVGRFLVIISTTAKQNTEPTGSDYDLVDRNDSLGLKLWFAECNIYYTKRLIKLS